MPITLPSWLQPADVAGDYQRGLQIGAQVAESRSRLAAQAQETTMRAQAEAQSREQEHALQQQRIATTAAYQQQQIQLKQAQLDQVKRVNDAKTTSAARQFSARQGLASDFDAIDQNPSLTDAQKDTAKTTAILRRAPEMGMQNNEVGPMLQATRAPKPVVPASVEDNGDFVQVTQPNGSIQLHTKPKAASVGNVTVEVPDPSQPNSEATVYRTMPRDEAQAVIAGLPPNLQTNAVNRAAMSGRATPANIATGSPNANYSSGSDAKSAPAKIGSKADFDALPPGALYVNPKDQKVYRKKGQPDAANSDSQ